MRFIEIKEKFDLCDIWRIRNTKEKSKRRLDIFIVSNLLQESVKDTEVLPAFSSNHSPILFSLVSTEPASKGKGQWKFNNSLSWNKNLLQK